MKWEGANLFYGNEAEDMGMQLSGKKLWRCTALCHNSNSAYQRTVCERRGLPHSPTLWYHTQMHRRPAAPSIPAAFAPPTAPALVPADSDSDSSQAGPAVLISPVKAWAAKRGIANKSDKDVWSLPDNDIIGE